MTSKLPACRVRTLTILLSIYSLLPWLSSSLVMRSTQGFVHRNKSRFLERDTSCRLEDREGVAASTEFKDDSPRDDSSSYLDRRRVVTRRKPFRNHNLEEKERRQLEWLVQNTNKILGPDDSSPVGSMSEGYIQLTYSLMKAWARRSAKKESKSPHVVERLLQRLLRERDAGNDSVAIDTSLYNIVLDAWSNSSEEGSAERCEEILLHMERMYNQGNEDVKPDEGSYNAVVKAYVKNGNRHIAAPKAESIVKRMERPDSEVTPNRRSYNLLLYALANSAVEDAASHAEETLHKMLDRYNSGDEGCKPDINSFNQVLGAWARGKEPGFEERMQSIYEDLLNLQKEMAIRPNTDTFNAVMGGWLKSSNPQALVFIEKTLENMEAAFEGGNKSARPDRITINTLAAAYAKKKTSAAIEKSLQVRNGLERKYMISPDAVSHNIVLDSWCKSGRAEAPGRVLELLKSMEREFKTGKATVKPDGYTYSSVIGCYVKCERNDATQVAEDLLKRMQDLHRNFGGDPPTTSVYNAVINAWASSNAEEALIRVKELLESMEENEGKDPSIPPPNRITYNTVIKAMRQGTKEDAVSAEKVLTTLELKGQSDPHLLPDSYSYTSVITAYGRSSAENKAVKSLEILERMILASDRGNMAATPTTHSYNAALNACAFVEGDVKKRSEAFDIAMKVYELLQQHGEPDQTTYGTLLRACATLLHSTDKRREKLVNEIFQEACEHGGVGRLVITQLKFAATPHQHVRLTGRDIVEKLTVKDLPREWTRNVREKSRRA